MFLLPGLVKLQDGGLETCIDFLFQADTPHNPVRLADTVGLVVERARPEGSAGADSDVILRRALILLVVLDRLRWYCDNAVHETATVVREEEFHVYDLGSQLKGYIERWQVDEEYRRCSGCGQVVNK